MFRPYPKMKNSGVGWLGQVPEHWGIKPLKHVVGLINEKAETTDGEYIGLENIESFTGRLIPSSSEVDQEGTSNLLRTADVLFGKLRPYLAKAIIAKVDGRCSSELLVLRPLGTIPSFLHYQVLSDHFIRIVDSSTYGTKMPRANWNFIGKMPVPVPDLVEQLSIAYFLDRKTALIDDLIAKRERQIELLQEQRMALISRAVTKGLNSDVPMKDSGVEWLGEIPETWGKKKLILCCSLLRDGTHLPPSRVPEGIPLLSVRNVIDGKFVNLPDDSCVSEEDYKDLCRSFVVKKGDVLLAIVGATLGKVAIVEDMPPFHIQRSLAVFRPCETILHFRYLRYFFVGLSFQRMLWSRVGFSAQPGIYLNTLAQTPIALPSLPEQQKITDYLDRETAKIDTFVKKVQQSIAKLREFRKSLISAAVTGKIDVRNWGAVITQ